MQETHKIDVLSPHINTRCRRNNIDSIDSARTICFKKEKSTETCSLLADGVRLTFLFSRKKCVPEFAAPLQVPPLKNLLFIDS